MLRIVQKFVCAAAKQCHSVFVNVMYDRYIVLNLPDVCFLSRPANRILKHDYDKDYKRFSFLLMFLMDLGVKISHLDWKYNAIKTIKLHF